MPSMFPEDLDEKKAALERYLVAHGFSPADSKVAPLRLPAPAAAASPNTSVRYRKPGPATLEERFQLRGLEPLQPVEPKPYNVADTRRYQVPLLFKKPAKGLIRNVQRRTAEAHAAEDNAITSEEIQRWRTQHLRMTPEQLAALLRVTARTIRGWESGQSRIPFMMSWVMQHLEPGEMPQGYLPGKPTAYAKPELVDNGSIALRNILKRYASVMKDLTITSSDFRSWRVNFMLMTAEQLAELIRENVRTIVDWEAGRKAIPFSMWWVMHVTMQDPEIFLTRPGFHDFRIDYVDGKAYLCSERYPDLRFTSEDLYMALAALKTVDKQRSAIAHREAEIERLQAENTHLRQMLKAGTVAAELKAMHEHIGNLMKQIHTADIVGFPDTDAAPAASIIHKAA